MGSCCTRSRSWRGSRIDWPHYLASGHAVVCDHGQRLDVKPAKRFASVALRAFRATPGTGTARKTPLQRFSSDSKTRKPAVESTRSDVRSSACDSRQPVEAKTSQNARTGVSVDRAAFRKRFRSVSVRRRKPFLRQPCASWRRSLACGTGAQRPQVSVLAGEEIAAHHNACSHHLTHLRLESSRRDWPDNLALSRPREAG